MRTSFAARIRLLVIAMSLGFGLSVLAVFHLLANGQVAAAADRDVRSVSGMLSAAIRGRSDLLRSLAQYTASSPRVRGLTDTEDVATVTDAAPGLRKDAGVDALMITDTTGRVLGAAGFATARPLGPSDPIVASAMRGKSSTGIVAIENELLVATSEPVYVGETQRGTFTAFARLGKNLADELKGEASLEIAFARGGKPIAGSFDSDGFAIPNRNGSVWTTRIGDREYVAKYAALPGTTAWDHVGFVVLRPLDETLGPYRQFSLTFLAVLAAVGAVALALGSVFAGNIVRSLEGLVRNAERLKRGDWPERLEVKRTDEIGLLESAFNEMATSLQISQDRLLAMIDSDPLTELANHRHFQERLGQEAARTSATGETLAMLLIDIDAFATFNSAHGHAAGDLKLQEIAAALRETAPEFSVLARYGGEEFAVLLPDGSVADAQALFEGVAKRVAGVTLTGGCAELAVAKGKSEDLVVAAELALTRAKELGPGRVCDFGAVPGSGDAAPMQLHRLLHDGTYATIKALAAAVDAKDAYTHGHSDRVAKYAADLAAFLGASPDEVDLIHRCGTLHDVGKIGVPDAVLQKPGRLDEEEIRVMQTHAALGEYIVSKVPQLGDLLPGVRHHHERYDGKGYPDGLKGEEIPRVARFLAIADTFDAMTSNRPYRLGMDPSVALREIDAMAGSQFDPELAIAFTRMMRAQLSNAA
ncbi:MAG: HD domain-containing phosphohydrolase [Fimbriimonas sp.]